MNSELLSNVDTFAIRELRLTDGAVGHVEIPDEQQAVGRSHLVEFIDCAQSSGTLAVFAFGAHECERVDVVE